MHPSLFCICMSDQSVFIYKDVHWLSLFICRVVQSRPSINITFAMWMWGGGGGSNKAWKLTWSQLIVQLKRYTKFHRPPPKRRKQHNVFHIKPRWHVGQRWDKQCSGLIFCGIFSNDFWSFSFKICYIVCILSDSSNLFCYCFVLFFIFIYFLDFIFLIILNVSVCKMFHGLFCKIRPI